MAMLDEFRACPVCGQRTPVTDSWALATHYADGARCAGSGEPVGKPAARRNTHGSRWR